MTRRQVLQLTTLLAAKPAAAAPFSLPALPYATDALEPHIDARTMEIHHGKHHQAYVDNLNKAIGDDAKLSQTPIEDLLAKLDTLPAPIRTAVRNQGGGHANHSLFWKTLGPAKNTTPKGNLAKAIDTTFGGYSGFQDKLRSSSLGVFGSGWAWLSLDSSNRLVIDSAPNQDSPLSKGQRPLFGIDVWEHAYYLKYQNRRADYITAVFNVLNWDSISQRYEELVR